MGPQLFCDWQDYPYYGMKAYRIWERIEGPLIMQAHEWMRKDGTIEQLNWIVSCRSGK